MGGFHGISTPTYGIDVEKIAKTMCFFFNQRIIYVITRIINRCVYLLFDLGSTRSGLVWLVADGIAIDVAGVEIGRTDRDRTCDKLTQ